MANYYCEYCGRKFAAISDMTWLSCNRHPDGANKGKHKLYEGAEKDFYFCKYCGRKFSSISDMTWLSCNRHPNGTNKGNHAPAL